MTRQRLAPRLPPGWSMRWPPAHHTPRPDKVFRGYVVFQAGKAVGWGDFAVSVAVVYADTVELFWRFLPDIAAMREQFPEDLRDCQLRGMMIRKEWPDLYPTERADEDAFVDELFVAELKVRRSLRLDDDVGTPYLQTHESFGTSGVALPRYNHGTAWYEPSLPQEASLLCVSAVGVTLAADLTHGE